MMIFCYAFVLYHVTDGSLNRRTLFLTCHQFRVLPSHDHRLVKYYVCLFCKQEGSWFTLVLF